MFDIKPEGYNYPIRIGTTRGHLGSPDFYEWIVPNESLVFTDVKTENQHLIWFKTEEERLNFFNSLQTIIMMYINSLVKTSTWLMFCKAPWLGDYTIKWNDEKLKEFFGITDEETLEMNKFSDKKIEKAYEPKNIPINKTSKIIEEFLSWRERQYAGKTQEERQRFGQYFTPPDYTLRMLDEYNIENINKITIKDTSCGCGGLLVAALICGAKPENIYGVELDKEILQLCKQRLNEYCDAEGLPRVPDTNIHQGNALCQGCFEFPDKDEEYIYDETKQEGKCYKKGATDFEKKFGGITLT
jgi:tRNA G10  N-methylase Trm11